jgi:GrpB-like predicted nucleotidyltransferase (UPF0157 family)
MPSPQDIMRHWDDDPDEIPWVAGRPSPRSPIAIVEPDPAWPAQYAELAERVRGALGNDVLDLEHVGSTSVPGLPAKPIIDIDLTVADSRDEARYVPPLEAAGFELHIREPSWHEHRCFASTRRPRCNLHVWSPDSPEAVRHRMLRDWLREHADDRERYAAAKRASADATNADGGAIMDYNRRKEPVIREILDRVFRAQGWR